VAKKNIQQEFLKHFLAHQEDLRAFICAMIRDRHTCDDILQDVAMILWEKFDQYDAARSFGAWARGIAANRVLQTYAKVKRDPAPLSPEVIQAVLEAFDASEPDRSRPESEALKKCMEILPEKSKLLVELRYQRSLKLKDMAEHLKTSLDAVHKALSRIRSSLRDCVEQQMALEEF
jgi:RNA polymerase sigma-70 factor, ECF subfamily